MNFLSKLSKIEKLIERASSEGERQAAILAKKRIQQKQDQHPEDYHVSHNSLWEKQLFVTLCNKHGLPTYRYKGQRHTTTHVFVSSSFMNEILWPEHQKFAKLLQEAVNEIMDELIQKIYKGNMEEVEVSGHLT